MTLVYVDTSALARAYLEDEPEHAELSWRLLRGEDPVVTSALTRVELASTAWAAARAGRVRQPELILERFDADCADDGPLALLRLDSDTCLPLACRLVGEHRLRTLDALHVAVALTTVANLAAGEPVSFLTRDKDQAAAAQAAGLSLA